MLSRSNFVIGSFGGLVLAALSGRLRALAQEPIYCIDDRIPFTLITCDGSTHRIIAPNLVVSPTIIDPLRDNEYYADTITIAEPLLLSGRRLRIFARRLIAPNGRIDIDVSAAGADSSHAGEAPQPNSDVPGDPGGVRDAATTKGRVPGTIEIYTNAFDGSYALKAVGGDGDAGRTGQQGGPGGATPQMTDAYICKRDDNWPGNPGMRGKQGAKGGQAGSGGIGSAGGNITLVTAEANPNVQANVAGGHHGDPGSPGLGGDPGVGGLGSPAWHQWVDSTGDKVVSADAFLAVVQNIDAASLHIYAGGGEGGGEHAHGHGRTTRCDVFNGTSGQPLILGPQGGPGPRGLIGDAPNDGLDHATSAADGAIRISSAAAPSAFALINPPVELFRSLLDRSILRFAAGSGNDVASTLSWLADVSQASLPAHPDYASMLLIGQQARELAVRIILGTDLYGSPPTNVSTASAESLGSSLDEDMNALQVLETATDRYKAELDQHLLSAAHLKYQTDVLNVQKQSIGDALNDLDAQNNALTPAITAQSESTSKAGASLQVALNAYDFEQTRIKTSCEATFELLIAAASLVYGIYTGGLATFAAFSALATDLSNHSENRKNLEANGSAIFDNVSKIVTNFQKLSKVQSPQESNVVLVVDRSDYMAQLTKIKQQISPDAPGGSEALSAVDHLQYEAQLRNSMLLTRSALNSRRKELLSERDDVERQLAQTASATSTTSLTEEAPYVAALDSRLRIAQQRVLKLMFYNARAFQYLTASDALPLNAGDFTHAVLLDSSRDLKQRFEDRLLQLNQDVGEVVTYTVPLSAVESLRTSVMTLSIPIASINGNSSRVGAWDRDMSNRVLVFAKEVEVTISKVKDVRLLDLELHHSGSAIVRDTNHRSHQFTHEPRGFALILEKRGESFAGKVPLTGTENKGLPLSPFSVWRLSINGGKSEQDRVDPTAVVSLAFKCSLRLATG